MLRKKLVEYKIDLIAVLALIILVVVIFRPLMAHMIWERTGASDHLDHIHQAANMFAGNIKLVNAYPLFQTLVGVANAVLPVEHITIAGLVVLLTCMTLTAIVIYFFVRRAATPLPTIGGAVIGVLGSLILMLVAAITVFTWSKQNLYAGYILPTVYHNGTILALKPFALLLFVYIVGVFSQHPYFRSKKAIVIAAILVLLATTAKPSYTICVLPALGIAVIYRLYKRQHINWWLLIGGIGIPALIVLGAEYLAVQYIPSLKDHGSQFIFSPFGYLRKIRMMDLILLKFILSIAFPLVVYLLYFKTAVQDSMFNLAWLIFIVGAIYYYFFIQVPLASHGNFTWSAQITLFILFIVAFAFFVRQNRGVSWRLSYPAWISLFVLGLHFVCGIVWYQAELTVVNGVWW
jgi:hypothetical protein